MKINKKIACGLAALILFKGNVTAQTKGENHSVKVQNYFSTNDTGIQSGGVKMITVQTKNKEYQVWTKRFGNNPKIKVLLLNGGPGCTHEYFECMESFLPAEGIEFIYYDQLACGNSDNPKDTSLYDLARYVEEVEQLRIALGLQRISNEAPAGTQDSDFNLLDLVGLQRMFTEEGENRINRPLHVSATGMGFDGGAQNLI